MSVKYADIIIDISHEDVDRTFQYRIPEKLSDDVKVGSAVKIPFGMYNSIRTGYVTGISDIPLWDESKIKDIIEISKDIPIEGQLIILAQWIKENYGSTMINALKTVMPVKKSVREVVEKRVVLNADIQDIDKIKDAYSKKHAYAKLRLLEELIKCNSLDKQYVSKTLKVSAQTLNSMVEENIITIDSNSIFRNVTDINNTVESQVELNNEQQIIIDEFKSDIENGIRNTYLLYGITGSGKTEIYVRAIKEIISQGKQAIMLIPEIALTYQTVKYFTKHFGDRVTIINSKLSPGEKFDQMERARKGLVDVVIGPRSALFTPFNNLGLIIIDEEHESSYKSDYPPKYHARNVAEKRAELANCSLILGSATPSVESYKKALDGAYRMWKLTKRAVSRSVPVCNIVDMRDELHKGNRSMISECLEIAIRDRLEKKEQIILFMNRRGYNSCVTCRDCGDVIRCPHCDVAMKKHNNGKMICHYCDFTIDVPKVCPSCKSKLIGGFGAGTQKVEEDIKKLFPEARVLRMDKDTTKTKDGHKKILMDFEACKADILVGTQMIVKGHDFPKVTLVGIMLADLTLFESDYRAGERTFDLICQAAGRAGRDKLPGEVVIQTYKPDNYAIISASNQNYDEFYGYESAYRALMKYPPEYNMMVALLVSDSEENLERVTELIANKVREVFAHKMLSVIGPATPVIGKIKDVFRRVIYVKHMDYTELIKIKDYIDEVFNKECADSNIGIQFDFNPTNMY